MATFRPQCEDLEAREAPSYAMALPWPQQDWFATDAEVQYNNGLTAVTHFAISGTNNTMSAAPTVVGGYYQANAFGTTISPVMSVASGANYSGAGLESEDFPAPTALKIRSQGEDVLAVSLPTVVSADTLGVGFASTYHYAVGSEVVLGVTTQNGYDQDAYLTIYYYDYSNPDPSWIPTGSSFLVYGKSYHYQLVDVTGLNTSATTTVGGQANYSFYVGLRTEDGLHTQSSASIFVAKN